jgi:hypothetical protein
MAGPFRDLRITRKVVNRCRPNNEVFIYDTAVVNLGHFVFFELIVNYERVRIFFFVSKSIF